MQRNEATRVPIAVEARRHGVSPAYLRDLVRTGIIPGERQAHGRTGRWLVHPEDVALYFRRAS
jgi:hypothetical protein